MLDVVGRLAVLVLFLPESAFDTYVLVIGACRVDLRVAHDDLGECRVAKKLVFDRRFLRFGHRGRHR
jgi:hypothetical protein